MYSESAFICELEDMQNGFRSVNLADQRKDHVAAAIDAVMAQLYNARDYLSEAASQYLVGLVDEYLAGFQQGTSYALAAT